MTAIHNREQHRGVDRDHPMQRIEDDHRRLRDQIDVLASATTRTVLLKCLLALPNILREHFAFEEQADGLYDELRSRRPSIAPELDALSVEHQTILDEFDALLRRMKGQMDAEQTVDEIAESVKRDIARSLRRLHWHEQRESRMISDTYYTDEGGRG